MNRIIKKLVIVGGLMALLSADILAAERAVSGKGIAFDPVVVFAEEGDTITFRNMATHFVESIKIPDGAEKMVSDMGADYDYKVSKPGVYFYKCPPHWGARMGGLIVVGDTGDLIETLNVYKETIDDKTGKGFLKKVIKKIEKGDIEVPK